MIFTDSIDENLETIKELLAGVPPNARNRAKQAAVAIENVYIRLQRDHPKDPAVALGAAFAIYTIAERIVQNDRGNDGKPLIELLS